MKKRQLTRNVIILSFIILTLTAEKAYAYLDPSAGSVILQIILGGVAGIAVLTRLYWRKLKGLFMRNQKGESG